MCRLGHSTKRTPTHLTFLFAMWQISLTWSQLFYHCSQINFNHNVGEKMVWLTGWLWTFPTWPPWVGGKMNFPLTLLWLMGQPWTFPTWPPWVIRTTNNISIHHVINISGRIAIFFICVLIMFNEKFERKCPCFTGAGHEHFQDGHHSTLEVCKTLIHINGGHGK